MKRAKMILSKFFHPPIWVLCTVPPASFAAHIFIFASSREEHAVAYPVFLLSAYSLLILLAALPALAGRLKQLKVNLWNHSRLIQRVSSTEFGGRYLHDQLFRSSISIYQGMTANFMYMLFRLVTAVQYASVWFFSMTVYYMVLCIMRAYLAFGYRRRKEKEMAYELQCYRRTAAMLFRGKHSNGRDDRSHGTNEFWVHLSGVFDLSIRIIYNVYNGSVGSKPCKVSKNGQPDPVRCQSAEFCICYDVRPWFADSNDCTFFFKRRGLPENDERHYRCSRLLYCYSDSCSYGSSVIENQKGGGTE